MILVRRGIITAVFLALVYGCADRTSQPPLELIYHTLDYPSPLFEQMSFLPVAIELNLFDNAPFLDNNQMVYQPKPFEFKAYPYHKWAAPPGALITHFLGRDLIHSRLFQAVHTTRIREPVPFTIFGTVEAFHEVDHEAQIEAALGVTLTLIDRQAEDTAHRVLFQKHYRIVEPCRRGDAAAVVQALSRAAARFSTSAIRDIHQTLTGVVEPTAQLQGHHR